MVQHLISRLYISRPHWVMLLALCCHNQMFMMTLCTIIGPQLLLDLLEPCPHRTYQWLTWLPILCWPISPLLLQTLTPWLLVAPIFMVAPVSLFPTDYVDSLLGPGGSQVSHFQAPTVPVPLSIYTAPFPVLHPVPQSHPPPAPVGLFHLLHGFATIFEHHDKCRIADRA
jgi:hypothetical protein